MLGTEERVFYNYIFTKSTLKKVIGRLISYRGHIYTAHILDQIKILGFEYSTRKGVSLGIDDLVSSPFKPWIIDDTEYEVQLSQDYFRHGCIHVVERLRHLVETWHTTSEFLKREMTVSLQILDTLNPVHMMAYSGARGNPSQVHQLVGMRGLMTDPEGRIIELPIQGSLREGLSLTEYIISCYGARKGVVDTAIRTADAGYLTRRLIQTAQHIVVRNVNCYSADGIYLSSISVPESNLNLSWVNRLIGRVLARPIYIGSRCIAPRNLDISANLARYLSMKQIQFILVRSPMTCKNKSWICQLCYGWGSNQNYLVEIGEAVGIIAAQSIGEPGTQLTLRTFHSGGVFTGDISNLIRSPINGIIYFDLNLCQPTRSRHGRLAWKCNHDLILLIKGEICHKEVMIPAYSIIVISDCQYVAAQQVIAEVRSSISPFKEKVQRHIYTSLQGEVRHTKSTLTLSDPFEVREQSIYPNQDISHIWVYSGEVQEYSGYQFALVYRALDFIEGNINIIRQLAKRVLYPFGLTSSCQEYTELSSLLGSLVKTIYATNYRIGIIQHIPRYQSHANLHVLLIGVTNLFYIKTNYSILSNESNLYYKNYNIANNLDKQGESVQQLKSDYSNLLVSYNRTSFLNEKISKPINFRDFFGLFLGTIKRSEHELYSKNRPNFLSKYSLLQNLSSSDSMKHVQCHFNFLNEQKRLYTTNPIHNIDSIFYNNINLCLFAYSYINFKLGQTFWKETFLNYHNQFKESANLIYLSSKYLILRSSQPFLLTADAIIHTPCFNIIQKGEILITLLYEQLKTSDIVQGLPKAEKLLEARLDNRIVAQIIHYFMDRYQFYFNSCFFPLDHYKVNGRRSINLIQMQILDSIQSVYLAQGVRILDKHVEVIIRQMTSKVLILKNKIPKVNTNEGLIDFSISPSIPSLPKWSSNYELYYDFRNFFFQFPIHTSLWLPGELADQKRIEAFNRLLMSTQNIIPYKPIILGMSRASLYTESFISEACFEQTTRVLITSALKGRVDWIKGLQENVVFNGIMPAGTGLISFLPTVVLIRNESSIYDYLFRFSYMFINSSIYDEVTFDNYKKRAIKFRKHKYFILKHLEENLIEIDKYPNIEVLLNRRKKKIKKRRKWSKMRKRKVFLNRQTNTFSNRKTLQTVRVIKQSTILNSFRFSLFE